MPPSQLPANAYRLQFNREFTFRAASDLIPYLHDLGIDTVYCSPYFQSVPGSPHGYNLTNPNQINPEIGSKKDHEHFCEVLRKYGMRQVLDIVPNHMGIGGSGNPWWQDVLENGPASIYAHFFDIQWEPAKKEIKDKVLLPILGDYYGSVLENGDIQLQFSDGSFRISYFDRFLPAAPDTYPLILKPGEEWLQKRTQPNHPDYLEFLSIQTAFGHLPARSDRAPESKAARNREKEIAKKRLAVLAERSGAVQEFIRERLRKINGRKGEPQSFDDLDRLLNEQSYRLAFWRVASEEINYRRFFDINELAAVRAEDPDVFQQYHALAFQLIQEGKVQGLRVDHPDGLYDPPEYFRRLQKAVSGGVLYVVAEKILEGKEALPDDWEIQGTVGYDFLNLLNGVFIKRENEKDFDGIYENFIRRRLDFAQLLYEKKKFFSLIYMSSEINALGNLLDGISERQRQYRDFTRNNLTLAIREVIACFPVYRTYVSPHVPLVSERDQRYTTIAIERARSKTPFLNPAVYDFLKRVLLLQWDGSLAQEDKDLYRDFVLRFQQLTGPIMAKGLEDTVFYIYNRLLSLNEVGSDPLRFGISAEEFHGQNMERNKRWPGSMLASSTHDTKRSEDVRARLNVLSELPEEWQKRIEKWQLVNKKHKTEIRGASEPDPNFEYFIYQTLLGVWPAETVGAAEMVPLKERLWDYFLKSAREAKVRTNWTQPDLEYEEVLQKFVSGILTYETENHFLIDFLSFQEKIAVLGLWNSLSASVLKLGAPGVTDTYQGCELWNYALVDPDNRRPVDYETRIRLLDEIREKGTGILPELLKTPHNGRLKLFVLWKILNFRKKNPDLFLGADYRPVKAEGSRKSNLIAFAREKEGKVILSAAGRFFSELLPDFHVPPAGPEVWGDTVLVLPLQWKEMRFKDLLTDKIFSPVEAGDSLVLKAAEVFSTMSVGFLTGVQFNKEEKS